MTAPDQADIPGAEDEPASEDLVAELDDEPDLTADDEADPAADDDEDGYQGVCVGGPWNGRNVTVRRPKGFLLIDTDAPDVPLMWLYDYADATFTVRHEQPRAMHDEGRWRAADEGEYDLLVLGAEVGEGEQP